MTERELQLNLKAKHFSLIWMALHDREEKLLKIIEENGEDSDEAALAGNDIIFLRLYRKELKQRAETVFNSNVFDLSEEPI
jgi:hypothetical protein